MSTWVVISWIFVGILTAINVFIFLKLKGASEQMLKMAFPNAKNMGDAMAQAQKMMGGMGGPQSKDAQLKAAMEMLKKKKR